MPPYPTTADDNDILNAEAKYINLIHAKLINLSHDIADNKQTTQRLLDERKALKCLLNTYIRRDLYEQIDATKIKLKDNMKFLDLIAEEQKSNKTLHSVLSASLSRATRQFYHGKEKEI